MNGILSITLGKPEHPSRVRGTIQGSTLTNYFHTPRRRCQGFTDEEVDILVEVKLEKERKIQEDE